MYIKLNNGVPEVYSLNKLRKDNPNTSFPKHPSNELLADWGVFPYTNADKPAYDNNTQYVTHDNWVQVEGAWVRDWAVHDFTAEELSAQLADKREQGEMERFDFAVAAAEAGFVTYAEAAAWAAGNSMPAGVQAVVDAMPAEDQGLATVEVLARPIIRRNAPMMASLMIAFNTDDAGVDALFGIV